MRKNVCRGCRTTHCRPCSSSEESIAATGSGPPSRAAKVSQSSDANASSWPSSNASASWSWPRDVVSFQINPQSERTKYHHCVGFYRESREADIERMLSEVYSPPSRVTNAAVLLPKLQVVPGFALELTI